MARAASAVPHQPDSTNPTWLRPPPPLSPWRLRSASSSFITLLPFASICPQHRGFTPSGTLPGASVRSAATPTLPPFRHQFAPTLYPMSTKAAPAGRRLTSAQRDSLNWCTPPAQRCSTSLFLHAGASRIARLIVFPIANFDCLFLFD